LFVQKKNGKNNVRYIFVFSNVFFFDNRQQKKRNDEARERQAEHRREAMNAQEVLRSLVEQIREQEGVQGLLILEAYYGHLLSSISNETSNKVIDVRVPLQTLVKNSTLKIETTVSKSNLTGFYDPCIGDEKSLFIKYSFHTQIHTVTYKDTDPVVLPNRSRTNFKLNSRNENTLLSFRSFEFLEIDRVYFVSDVASFDPFS